MPCYALSLTYNDIDYDVKDIKEFTVDNIREKKIKEGSFYHYYNDGRPVGDSSYGAFYKSKWYKQMYHEKNLLLDEDLDKYLEDSKSDHEKHFFTLAIKARNKINK